MSQKYFIYMSLGSQEKGIGMHNLYYPVCQWLDFWANIIRALDKSSYPLNIFLISPQKHMLWVLIEASWQGTSNKCPEHMFSWRNKKISVIFGGRKTHLIWSYL